MHSAVAMQSETFILYLARTETRHNIHQSVCPETQPPSGNGRMGGFHAGSLLDDLWAGPAVLDDERREGRLRHRTYPG
jgi:hypothetical protein